MENFKLYPFHLVEFITKGKSVARSVDCLEIQWIRYDTSKKKFMAKYMPPPYTEKTKAILRLMVEGQLDASDHWPEFNVKLIGHAQTYAEAEQRLDVLNAKETAYSSESDMNAKEKAESVINLLKTKRTSLDLQEVMNVPKLGQSLTSKTCEEQLNSWSQNATKIYQEIKGLKSDIKELFKGKNTIITMLENLHVNKYGGKISFAEKYDIPLPLKTVEDLRTFENKVKTDEECSDCFKNSLSLLFDRENQIRKSITNMVKKYMSRELAMKFTALKRVPNKLLFKDFYMCSCIVPVVCEKYKVSEDEVFSHLGTTFMNSKDWDGNRKLRVTIKDPLQ